MKPFNTNPTSWWRCTSEANSITVFPALVHVNEFLNESVVVVELKRNGPYVCGRRLIRQRLQAKEAAATSRRRLRRRRRRGSQVAASIKVRSGQSTGTNPLPLFLLLLLLLLFLLLLLPFLFHHPPPHPPAPPRAPFPSLSSWSKAALRFRPPFWLAARRNDVNPPRNSGRHFGQCQRGFRWKKNGHDRWSANS